MTLIAFGTYQFNRAFIHSNSKQMDYGRSKSWALGTIYLPDNECMCTAHRTCSL